MEQQTHTQTEKTRKYPEMVLIGPVGAGKSTIGQLLVERLQLPGISLDEIAEKYYDEMGVGDEVRTRLIKEIGFGAMYQQTTPALAHAVVRMFEDHDHAVFDLGAGHSHFEDALLFAKVQQALAPCPNVVFLLPSPDLDQSVEILRARSIAERGWDWNADGYDYIAHWVKDACNHVLATLTVYTEGRTPAETCEEILTRIRPANVR